MNWSNRQLAVGAMLTTALLGAGAPANASDSPPEGWQYGVMIYGWLPSVSGDLNYGPSGSGSGIDVDAGDILDALQMTFMGSFEVRKGLWSGFTDVIYLELGGDKSRSVTVPDGADRNLFNADLEFKGWVWTLGGAYTAWQKDGSHLDLLAGARLLALDTDLKLTGGGPPQPDRKLSDSENLWDGILGAKGRLSLTRTWFVPYYADVGTGDSDLTWQVAGGVGYAFHWGEVSLMYRYLKYDQGSDELLQEIAFGGPQLGVAFRF